LVSDDDGKSKPPSLKVVSENPNAPDKARREIMSARGRAQRALAELAATILRAMAGSESASYDVMHRIGQLIDAQKELYDLSGEWPKFDDEQKALNLPQSDLDSDTSDHGYRQWQRNRGMECIVQGALRLAAHQVLRERPHFGGKHSERLIEDGIAMVERACRPPATPKPPTKREKAEDRASRAILKDLVSTKPEPPVRKKPWSSRDSRSFRDPKPED
jgi:hypothetical protein